MKSIIQLPLQTKKIAPVFLTALALCLAYCQSPGGARRERVEMEFMVDSTLVDRVVTDPSLSISYRVPGTWKDLTEDTTIVSRFRQQDSTGKILLKKLLQNDQVLFSLTDIRNVPDTSFTRLRTQPEQVLNANHQWTRVDTATFFKDSFRIRQYVMTGNGMSNFKLLFSNEVQPIFQVDFLLPIDSAYASRTKIFESIIGSFKRKG